MRITRANTPPAPRPRTSNRYGGGSVDRAKEAAIERSLSAVFPLNCGHITYILDQQGWAVWRPKNNKHGRLYFCEKCNDWVNAKPKPKPPVYPEEPLF